MIHLHVEPRIARTWDQFLEMNPPFSIALDGYVDGPPAFSSAGPHANFDHHRLVDRLSTRSTCMQVFMAVTMGLFDTFQRDGGPHAEVFVNDPDQDTCLAVWVLRHPGCCEGLSVDQPIARLLLGEDILDCTGGAYPVPTDRALMRQQAWVFAPYFDIRASDGYSRLDSDAMQAVIESVGERITAFMNDQGEEIDLDTRYDRIGGGAGWELIVEHGPHARTALFSSGVRAFVAVRENRERTWTYTVGKMSPFVRFPILEFYELFNKAEGLEADSTSRWGGSNTIGGSPRKAGSRLSPSEVEQIINAALDGVD